MSILLSTVVASYLTLNGASYHFSPPDPDTPSGRTQWNEINYGLGFEFHTEVGLAMIGTLKDSNENPMHYLGFGPKFQLTENVEVDVPVGIFSRVFYNWRGEAYRNYKIAGIPRLTLFNDSKDLGVAAYYIPMTESDAVFLQVLVRWD